MPRVMRWESQHELPFPREQVWPVLRQTDWINRASGLPPVEYDLRAQAEGGSAVTARARVLGWELRWRELPFEWLEPEFYRVHRVFENGPLVEAWLGLELRPTGDDGTRVVVSCEVAPRNVVGAWVARGVLGRKTNSDMARVVAHVSEYLSGRSKVAIPKLPVHSVNEAAFQAGFEKLRRTGQPADLVHRLEEFLRQAPDVEVSRLRPFALARRWGTDRWDVLRLCLHATRSGLLDLSWEILCPNCRSSREPLRSSLADLARTSHCEVCQIKFDAQFDESVELKFAINPSVRPRDETTYCLAGPGGKPHVLSQILLDAGQRRAWKLPMFTQPLRLRSPQVKQPVKLQPEAAPDRMLQPVVLCKPDQFTVRFEYGQLPDAAVQILNPNAFPVLLAVERTEWDEDILTAARATNWQDFRDLFASQVISPTEQVTVGSQVILFTDLRGSTAMYHGLGDAPAYVLVRNHFAVLIEAIRAHHGALVKTIGDAVMAVFSRLDEGLRAVQQMHARLPAANPDPSLAARLALKSSLHVGPCLAVNANDKLDFFGTTVNLAARMVECCRGGDLTVSDEVYHRQETVEFLKSTSARTEAAEIRFRGFDQPQKVWRLELA